MEGPFFYLKPKKTEWMIEFHKKYFIFQIYQENADLKLIRITLSIV